MLGGIIPHSDYSSSSGSPSPPNSGVSRLARRASVSGGPFSYPRSQCRLALRIFSHELDLGATLLVAWSLLTTASAVVHWARLRPSAPSKRICLAIFAAVTSSGLLPSSLLAALGDYSSLLAFHLPRIRHPSPLPLAQPSTPPLSALLRSCGASRERWPALAALPGPSPAAINHLVLLSDCSDCNNATGVSAVQSQVALRLVYWRRDSWGLKV